MSLWKNVLDTYEVIQPITGLIAGSGNETGVQSALLPLNCMRFPVQIIVTINTNGEAVDVPQRLVSPKMIIAPCTEESLGRSSGIAPHPLFDRLEYLDSNIDEKRTKAYLQLLGEWKGDNPGLNAVYKYVSTQHISDSLPNYSSESDSKKKKDIDSGVCFHVVGLESELLEDNPEIRDQWNAFLAKKSSCSEFESIHKDSIGENLTAVTKLFPRAIISDGSNARLISSNDSENFTYRGRYDRITDPAQSPLVVDALAMQKIRVTLRWLVGNNGTRYFSTTSDGKPDEDQAVIVWSLASSNPTLCDPFGDSMDVFESLHINEQLENDADRIADTNSAVGRDYSLRFRKILKGIGNPEKLKNHRRVAVLILNATSKGRLSVTYYQELESGEFIEKIIQWHIDTSWPLERLDADGRRIRFIGSPSIQDIVNATYCSADLSGKRYEAYRKYAERLLVTALFNNGAMPSSCLWSGFHKVTRPMIYFSNDSEKTSPKTRGDAPASRYRKKERRWRREFEVVCSLWKKQYNRQIISSGFAGKNDEKGKIDMDLEPDRTDRDYLYGRLLALADNFENRVIREKNERLSDDDKIIRPTNAMKLMSNFTARPFTTWGTLMKQLNPYFTPEFKCESFFKDVDDVMRIFKKGDFESNKPLSPLYLLGYSAQRRGKNESLQRVKKTDAES